VVWHDLVRSLKFRQRLFIPTRRQVELAQQCADRQKLILHRNRLLAGVVEVGGLAHGGNRRIVLRRALLDAKSWFGSTATWVGKALGDILRSEPAQKALVAVAEGVTKAAVDSFLK
jgi:hypothetical protein